MAGRPKREEEVKVVFLRLPTDLLKRVTRCTGMIATREGVRLDQTKAFRRLLEIACDAVEHRQTPLAPLAVSETLKLAEIAHRANGTPTAYDDMLAFLGDEDEEEAPTLPAHVSQVAETPEPVAQPAPASHVNEQEAPASQPTAQPAIPLALEPAPTTAHPVAVPQVAETPRAVAVHHGRPGISPETLQAIADERTRCEGLSLKDFAQRLFDKQIYRSKGKDEQEVPVDHSRLRRWLDKAREAGLL
jgi:hypothetical protein